MQRANGVVLASVVICQFLAMLDRNLLAVLAPAIKLDLGLSDAAFGLIQGTGFALLYAAATIPSGHLADRLDRRLLLFSGVGVWSVGVLGFAMAPSFGALFAAALLVGLGQAVLPPAAISLIAGLPHPERRGRHTAVFTSGAVIGRGTALIGGGFALGLLTASGVGPFEPWRSVIVLSLMFNIAVLVVLSRSFGRSDPGRAPRAKPQRALEAAFWIANHPGRTLGVFTLMLATVLVLQTAAAWTPSLLVRRFDLTPATAGLYAGLVGVFLGVLGHVAGGWLIDVRMKLSGPSGPFEAASALLLVAVPAFALFALGPTLAASLAGLAIFATAMGAATPTGLVALQNLSPPAIRGGITGLLVTGTTLGGIGLGPLLVGYGSDLLGATGRGLGLALVSVLLPVKAVAIAGCAIAARRERALKPGPEHPGR